MRELQEGPLAARTGGADQDLGREAQASLALIPITLAVILTITIVGFPVS